MTQDQQFIVTTIIAIIAAIPGLVALFQQRKEKSANILAYCCLEKNQIVPTEIIIENIGKTDATNISLELNDGNISYDFETKLNSFNYKRGMSIQAGQRIQVPFNDMIDNYDLIITWYDKTGKCTKTIRKFFSL